MRYSTIQMNVTEITNDVINAVISAHKESHNRTKSLYERYNQENLEIQRREFKDPKKANNRLAHDYRAYIVNQVVGYLFGHPISYQIDKTKYQKEEKKLERYKDLLSDFNTLNSIDDADSELGKLVSICGYAARLMYVNQDKEACIMNLNPWEVVFIKYRNTITHAVRYFTYEYLDGAQKKTERYAEWYSNTRVEVFKDNGTGEGYSRVEDESKEHLSDYLPVILFQNNDEEKGDFEKVETMIDAYDKNRSDSINEVETFANAYMKFKGVSIDKETIEDAKQTGGFEIPEDGDVDFITKNINDTFVENNRKALNDDIHKFAASVDMNDEKFSGSAQTGESRKWKLIDLETKAGTKVRKFGKGLRSQFKVLCSIWEKRYGSDLKLNYLDVYWDFKRNLPIDIAYIAKAVSDLNGIHSKQTLLSLIPYIDDVTYELLLMQEEADNAIDLDKVDKEEDNE